MTIRFSRRASLLLFFAIVAAVAVAVYFLVQRQPLPGVELTELNGLQKLALDVMLEMNKLAISVALLVFAGIGALLTAERPLVSLDDGLQRLLITLSLGAAAVSLYASYVVYDKLVEMLAAQYFDPNNPVLLRPRDLQVDAVLIAVVLLAASLLAGTRRS